MRVRAMVIAVALLIIIVCIVWAKMNYISVRFADEIALRYHYGDTQIDAAITDDSEVSELKRILNGISFRDNLSCGFSMDVSITFSDGNKSITLCPAAGDTCPFLRVNDSDRYIRISNKQRQQLANILEKYGMVLPC